MPRSAGAVTRGPYPEEVSATPPGDVLVLDERDWLGRQARHEALVDGLLAGHRARARTGTSHPVEDFLFTYYSLRPSRLRRWHPGLGVALAGRAAQDRLSWRWYRRSERVPGAVVVDTPGLRARREATARFVRGLLLATSSRPAHLGCFGLHEWAMVYRQDDVGRRHAAWPLRLGAAGTDSVVERHRIRCTHFDAFRFFTPQAVALNTVRPRRETQAETEQPGCLHATMDLYKWAYKLSPAVGGDLLAECFALARDVRVLDMRASPYDLSALGLEPVPIETPEGKAEYARAQRRFAQRAEPLRRRLVEVCDVLLAVTPAQA